MDEKPDEIINHIESQRSQLGRNLQELETRVRRTTDWRVQFDRNPMMMMGVAAGGGLLIGSIIGRSRRRQHWSSKKSYMGPASSPATGQSTSAVSSYGRKAGYGENRKKATDTVEQLKSAVVAFVTSKVKEFMSEALPGFGSHLEEAERRHPYTHGNPPSSGYAGVTRTDYPTSSPYSQEPTRHV